MFPNSVTLNLTFANRAVWQSLDALPVNLTRHQQLPQMAADIQPQLTTFTQILCRFILLQPHFPSLNIVQVQL